MRIEKREYKVYSFDELSEEAQANALNELRYINVDHDFWMYDDLPSDVVLTNAGIGFDRGQVNFDLDRADYLYFDTHNHDGKSTKGIWVENQDKLAKTLQASKLIDAKTAKAIRNGDLYMRIESKHYGGGNGRNYVDIESITDAGYAIADKIDVDALTDWLNSILNDRKKELRQVYEDYTSDEAIIDTINANEYEFSDTGKLFGAATV